MKTKIRSSLLATLVFVAILTAHAAPLTGARITTIVNAVLTIEPGKAPRKSALNEFVDARKSIRTGIDSRTELLFNDQTITRLGANSHFSFNEGTRELSISQGVILLQVPKGSGGATIQTKAVTAAITGTTLLFEVGPKSTTLTVVEGKCFLICKADRLHRRTGLTAGQKVTVPNYATEVPASITVNLGDLVKNSPMFTGEWGAILDMIAIADAIAEQEGTTGAEPLPFLAAFGFGSFPPGGGSSASGSTVSIVLPSGRVAYYDSLGRFIRFQ